MNINIEIKDETLNEFSEQIANSLLVQARTKVRKHLRAEMQGWIDEINIKLKESVITEQFWRSLRQKCSAQLNGVLLQEATAFCLNYKNSKHFNELLERIEGELFDGLFKDEVK